MPGYRSVDELQGALAAGIFARAHSPKKAAGRALGTLVELITFYLIREWGFERHLGPRVGNR